MNFPGRYTKTVHLVTILVYKKINAIPAITLPGQRVVPLGGGRIISSEFLKVASMQACACARKI